MKYFWIIGLGIFSVLFFFISCKKQDRRDVLFQNGWSEMDSISDRSFFPPNITTWIYEDSVSKELDTVSFVNIEIDTTEVYYTDYPDVLFYTKIQKTIALYNSKSTQTTYYSSLVGDPFVFSPGTIKKSVNQGTYTFAITPLAYKFKHTTLHGPAGVFKFHAVYNVNGSSYMNVAEIEQPFDLSLNGDHTTYFCTPNYGVVKLVNYNSNKVWQLVTAY